MKPQNKCYIKSFVPWAKTSCSGSEFFSWWAAQRAANEITKAINADILKAMKELK